MSVGKSIFTAESLSSAYGREEILREVSFSLEAGQLTALLGLNGCGKTTLMKCIAQRLSHDGCCKLKGEGLETLNTRQLAQRLSYIPQRSGVRISLPVLDVVLMGFNSQLSLLARPSKTQVNRAVKALESVGMQDYADRDYQTLSEGQKQLVILARLLVEESSLLLLDEPDSALDFQNRYGMLWNLRKLCEEKQNSALLCLHDPHLALEFCSQLILLKDGRVHEVLHPEQDSLSKMEKALQDIYGSISLMEQLDAKGKRRLILLWEGRI